MLLLDGTGTLAGGWTDQAEYAGRVRRPCPAALVLVVLGALVVGACDSDPNDRSGEQPLVLDSKRGIYERVRLGDRTARVIQLLGRPERRGPNQPGLPIGEEGEDIGVLNAGSPDIGRHVADFDNLRYKRRVFGTVGGRVTDWGTTDKRAETPEGVGIGDSRELVKRRYRQADCYIKNEDTEYVSWPICEVRVCKGRLLGFGGSPIKSIWLAAETKVGLKTCLPR
jgi:hypothetical protein